MAAVVALSPPLVIYSQLSRSYMLHLLFVSLLLWCYLSYTRLAQRRYLIIYVVVSLLDMLTHFSACFPIFAIGLSWLLFLFYKTNDTSRFKAIWQWMLIHFFLGLAYVASVYPRLTEGGKYSHFFTNTFDQPLGAISHTWNMFGWYFYSTRSDYPWIFPICGLLGIIALAVHKRWYVFAPIVIVGISALLARVYGLYPLSSERFSFFLAPFFLIAIAAPLYYLRHHFGSFVGRTGIAVVFFFFLMNIQMRGTNVFDPADLRSHIRHYFPFRVMDLRNGTHYVNRHSAAGDLVVLDKSIRAVYRFNRRFSRAEPQFRSRSIFYCPYRSLTAPTYSLRKRGMPRCFSVLYEELQHRQIKGTHGWLFAFNEFRGKRRIIKQLAKLPYLKIAHTFESETLLTVSFDIEHFRKNYPMYQSDYERYLPVKKDRKR